MDENIGGGRAGAFKLFMNGGTLQLLAGSFGLVGLLLDYGWSQPALGRRWDPEEEGQRLRLAVTVVAIMYVFASVSAAIVYWRFMKAGTMARAVHLFLGCLLLILVLASNGKSDDFYVDDKWHGAHWKFTQDLLFYGVMVSAVGYLFSFPCEEWGILVLILSLVREGVACVRSCCTWVCEKRQSIEDERREPLLDVDTTTEEERDAEANEQDNTRLEDASSGSEDEETARQTRFIAILRQRSERARQRQSDVNSMSNVLSAFCRASHAPFVFGCGAYVLALSVCAFSLILSFYSFEPNTQCFSFLASDDLSVLDIAPGVRPTYPLGERLVLQVESSNDAPTLVISDKYSANEVIWKSIGGEAFLRVGLGSLESYGMSGVSYYDDEVEWITDSQTIESIEQFTAKDGTRALRIHGSLIEKSLQFPYTVSLVSTTTISDPGMTGFSFELNELRIPDATRTSNLRLYMIQARNLDKERKKETLFGFGSQLSYASFDSGCIPIVAREKGIGRGLQPFTFLLNRFDHGIGGSWQHAHTAIPYFFSSSGRTMYVEEFSMVVFDLMNQDRINVEMLFSPGAPVYTKIHFTSYHNKTGQSPWSIALMKGTLPQMGTPQQLPDWSIDGGIIMNIVGGSEAVLRQIETYTQNGIQVGGVIIRDWCGMHSTDLGKVPFLNWDVDRSLYPDWEVLVARLRKQHVKVMIYFSPYVAKAPASLLAKSRPKSNLTSTYTELLHANCLIRNIENELVTDTFDESGNMAFAFADLFDSTCQTLYASILRRHAHMVDGWVADHGEALPFSASRRGPNRENGGILLHHEYISKWLETSDMVRGSNGNEIDKLVISRTAAATNSISKIQLHNLGHQLSSFDSHDGLASALKGIISSGFSGLSQTNSYIGGVNIAKDAFSLLHFDRSKELLVRWLELAVFTDPVLVTHSGINLATSRSTARQEFKIEQLDDILDHAKTLLELNSRLGSYKKKLLSDATQFGIPMVRHMWLQFPHDGRTKKLDRQFMLGENVLVCPVLTMGNSKVQCYIPIATDDSKPEWVNLWSLEILEKSKQGGYVSCHAPPGKPCVYMNDLQLLRKIRGDRL